MKFPKSLLMIPNVQNGEEISLDRQSSHVVTFYIRSVETTKVQYNWIGAENLGDDVKLPTDTGDYNWGTQQP